MQTRGAARSISQASDTTAGNLLSRVSQMVVASRRLRGHHGREAIILQASINGSSQALVARLQGLNVKRFPRPSYQRIGNPSQH